MKEYLTFKNIVVACVALLSLPAMLWSLIMVMAGGMKSVPSMSEEEVAMGVAPSLALLLIYTVIPVLQKQLNLPKPLLVACVLAGGVCMLAIALGFFAYFLQPGR